MRLKVSQTKPIGLVIENKNGFLIIKGDTFNDSLSAREKNEVKDVVHHIFRSDEDFNGFYRIYKNDPQLKFVSQTKSKRLLRSPTVFEDIIQTICTTNCDWANTKAMVSNLCDLENGCFPSPKTILNTGIKKLQKKCRFGYRARPIYEFSKTVNKGGFEPDSLLIEKNTDLLNAHRRIFGRQPD